MSQESLLILKNPKKETEKSQHGFHNKEAKGERTCKSRNRARPNPPLLFSSSSSSSSSSCLVPVTACDLQVWSILPKTHKNLFVHLSLFLHTIQGSQTLYNNNNNNNNQVLG
jgi:hypothetical protein